MTWNKTQKMIALSLIAAIALTALALDTLPAALAQSIPETVEELFVLVQANTSAIAALDARVTTNESDISQNTIDIAVNAAQLAILQDRVDAIPRIQLIANADLSSAVSSDGQINPQSEIVLFYGDNLCKVRSGTTDLIIFFDSDATVQHLTDCTTRNGDLIELKSGMDEFFEQGDILVLEQVLVNWEEVYQE